MNLLEIRKKYGLTIEKVSEVTGIPVRTYIRYEKDETYGSIYKRKAIEDILKECFEVAEDKGILSFDTIKKETGRVLGKYKGNIQFCYLFGSYAKGYAGEKSDVDLLISTSLTGLEFVGLIEELRQSLNKRVDLLRLSDLNNNIELINEIMKDGIKIYE